MKELCLHLYYSLPKLHKSLVISTLVFVCV